MKLGDIYCEGDGIEKDLEESFRWCSWAAERKDWIATIYACKCLIEGIGVKRNAQKGENVLLDAGSPLALQELACYYRRGIGVAVNKK